AAQEAQQTGEQFQGSPAGVSCTAFSDTIVISVAQMQSPPMLELFTAVVGTLHLCQRLLEIEVLTRGGVAKGEMYHKDGVLFGRGMIDAYHLEKNVSKVPRIAVAPDVASEWREIYGRPKGL